ncbi:EGF-like domain protein (macronuclear) [Tetrahymena thermophila SB210]|uniref:EGF-like domain protein n=1 Tax=Tetrahymena thermophila (strain SB210) TaxID=312017 RepID=Q237H2_TETTS|nr:EGF-like domain protein [Tetrahymena thermophila SB210]EAR92769.2 EGF-like domain protein [Tetrahymena thermophila SB210]|eukprot:XP_001013014.2 EGF-like domain protein [Tetrahymena thermophila SB210]
MEFATLINNKANMHLRDQYYIVQASINRGAKILSFSDSSYKNEISIPEQKWLKFSQVNSQDYIVGTELDINNYSQKSAQLEGCSDPISSLIYFEAGIQVKRQMDQYNMKSNKNQLIIQHNCQLMMYLLLNIFQIVNSSIIYSNQQADQTIRDPLKKPLLEYGQQEHKGMQITDIISIQDKIISGDEKGVLIERQIDDSLNGCIQGYFFNINNCQKCNDICKTCENSASNCTSCFENQQRELKSQGSTQTCACKQNFQEGSDNVCVDCHPSCLTCWLPNNPLKCSSCDDSDSITGNKQAQISIIGLQSKCICKDGYYQDDHFLCKKCPKNCKTCTSSSQCTSCVTNPNYLFQLIDGKCKCSLGYYSEEVDSDCKKCPIQCKSCESSLECLECQNPVNNNRLNLSQDKLCNCMPGYYYDGKNIQCQQCSKYCQKCDSQNNCLECQDNLNRMIQQNGQCQCKEGFYEQSNGQSACIQCPYNCKTCDNQGKCTSCPDSSLFFRKQIGSQNNCDCIDGYFDDGKSKECQKCDDNCLSCNQKGKCLQCASNNINNFSGLVDTNGNCLCQDGYYLDDTFQCKKCPYYCKTCQNSIQCLSCNNDQNYYRQSIDKSNKCECQQGFYDNAQLMCERCPLNCLSCNIKGCTECNQNNNRKAISESPTCECKDGFYQLSNSAQCQKCPQNCLTCDNQGNCLSCDSKSNRKSISQSKNCQCQDGFYEDQNSKECKKCSQNCKICSSFDKCIQCDENQFRILNQNTSQCECNEGYFENQATHQCQKCHNSCKQCLGPSINECSYCFSDQNRVLKDNICICKPGFIENKEQICQTKCHYSCDKCLGNLQNQCLECGNQSQTFRELNKQKQICQCLEGYYDAQGQQNCNKCHQTCKTCTDKNKNDCLTCFQKDFRVFNKESNSCICMSGYYENQQTGQCEKCHDTCQECFGSGDNQCSKCDELSSKRKLNQNNQCQCIQNYSEKNKKCEADKLIICDLTCQICDQEQNQICYKCKTDMGLQYDSTNKKCICNSGQYFNKQIGTCSQCDQNCETCEQNSSQCLTCKAGKQLNRQNQQCETIVFPSNIPKTVIQQVYNVTESSTYVSVGATASGSILLSFISPNGNLVSQFLSIQKLNLILLVNLALPELLYVFFKAVGGNSPLILIQNLNILNKFIVHDSTSPQLSNKFSTENIDSSIFINGGGILTVVVSILTIFIPSVLLYKNNFLIINQLHQYSLFAQRSKKIYENIVSSALIQVHEIIMLVSYFSIGTQILSLFLYGCKDSLSYYRIVFTLILTIYFCRLTSLKRNAQTKL